MLDYFLGNRLMSGGKVPNSLIMKSPGWKIQSGTCRVVYGRWSSWSWIVGNHGLRGLTWVSHWEMAFSVLRGILWIASLESRTCKHRYS